MSFLSQNLKNLIGKLGISLMLFFCRLNSKRAIGRGLFFIYKMALRLVNMSVLPVVNAITYKDNTNNVELKDIETSRTGVTANIIMVGSDEKAVFKESLLPDLRVKVFHNVCVQGNSDVVVDVQNGFVISEEAYNVKDNVEIIDGLLYRTSKNFCMLRDNLCHKKEHILTGIMISGKFCKNYYHLMYENLIKLLHCSVSFIPDAVPLVIDKETLDIPSCKTIIGILNNKKRKIITIDDTELYNFETLYCLDHVNSLPSHLIDIHKSFSFIYSPSALLSLRSFLLSCKSSKVFPNRVFISRTNTKRRRFNEDEIYSILQKFGFEKVCPEQLSFEDQVALFFNARYIVSGSGAALTNLLFVNNTCTVICLGVSSYVETCEVPVFNTIAAINGADFYFFPRKNSANNNVHADFEIDCEDFKHKISTLIQKDEDIISVYE